jgi:hypothetical protein
MGERGLELAVYRFEDGFQEGKKVLSFSKSDLSIGNREVLSIEGSALVFGPHQVELYVSSEKATVAYPPHIRDYQKPGTGVWTIDRMTATRVEELDPATMTEVVSTADPQFLHVKDPFVCRLPHWNLFMGFCTHPFNWASSNGGFLARREPGGLFDPPVFDFFPRGYTWDAGISRPTAILPLPHVGAFEADDAPMLMFYDGGESMRNLDEHSRAVKRPRGYSCEELGGAALVSPDMRYYQRLDVIEPMFVSPWGTGCSRYVDVVATGERLYATWQQAQEDGSQPLVMRSLALSEVEELLVSGI